MWFYWSNTYNLLKINVGYHFDYLSGNLEESTLETLRLWPTDKQISQTIKHSRQLACELAEFLGMVQPADISLERNSLQILISAHDKEVSISKKKNGNEEQDENIETADTSAAIAEASHEMKRISTEEYNEEDLSNLFQEGCSQLIIIDQVSEDISVLDNGDSSKLQQFK